jgi:hypothetical protein
MRGVIRQLYTRGTIAAGAPTATLVTIAALVIPGNVAMAVPATVNSTNMGVTFIVPPYCAVHQGPGTIDAVCDPDGDSDKSIAGPASTALYFEVVTTVAADEKSLTPEALGQRYSLDAFKAGLGDTVCGQDKPRGLKIENAERAVEGTVLSYTATVTCPDVRFMGLGPRRASVRHVLRDGRRYQIQARALAEDFDRVRPDLDTFFDSLKFSSERTP